MLSADEERSLVGLLKKLKPGFYPYSVFEEFARLVALSIIEFVPLRLADNGTVQLLLIERGNDDPVWPGELHTPGTVIRPTDTEGEMYRAFERIVQDELAGVATTHPYFVGSQLHKSKRGTEQAQIYWLELLSEPKIGKFYDIDKLPDNVMESQLKFIQLAVDSFKKYKGV